MAALYKVTIDTDIEYNVLLMAVPFYAFCEIKGQTEMNLYKPQEGTS